MRHGAAFHSAFDAKKGQPPGWPFSVSKKYFRPAVRILKLSKSFKILLIERAVGFLPPAHTPRCSVAQVLNEVF